MGAILETYAACNHCHAVNRVKVEKLGDSPKCSRCHQLLPFHGAVVELNEQALHALISNSPLPVAVDFWAAWCGPCRAYSPIFADLAQEQLGQRVFAKVDTEKEQGLSAAMGIRGIPATVLFQDGLEIKRRAGAMPKDELANWLAI